MPIKIQMPAKLREVFEGKYRYRGAYGGRGSGKSMSFATYLLIKSIEKPVRILCCRNFNLVLKIQF